MKIYLLVACGLVALLVVGCKSDDRTGSASTPEPKAPISHTSDQGEGSNRSPDAPRPLHISLDNWEGPESVGILMAHARGFFARQGLAVTITRGATPRNPLQYVKSGLVELGLAHEPQVVLAREEGLPIVAIGSLVPRTTSTLIWLKHSGIDGISGLEGKTIATAGIPFETRFLESILAAHGVPPEKVTIHGVGHGLLPALLRGRADAIFGGSWNLEGVALKARGLEPVITHAERLGVPAYEEVMVIARADRLAEDPKLFRDFMAAVASGTEAAIANPASALKVVLDAPERNGEVGRKATNAQLRATLPLLSRSGLMSEERAAGLVEWMAGEGIVEEQLAAGELMSNDYVEGR